MLKLFLLIALFLNIACAVDTTSMPRTSSGDSSHSDTDDPKDSAAKRIQRFVRSNTGLNRVQKQNSRLGMRNMPPQEETYLSQLKIKDYPQDQDILDWLAHEGLISSDYHKVGQGSNESKLIIQSVEETGNSSDGIVIINACDNRNNPNVTDPDLPHLCKNVYVLKIMTPQSAGENLQLQHVENDLLSKIDSLDPKMPKITYAERTGYYLTASNEKVYFQLIHAAQGHTLGKILDYFLSNPNENRKILTESFTVFGEQLGYLHNKFLESDPKGQLKTIIHGDLHPWNVFYDPTTGTISLIDNNRARIDEPKADIAGFIIFTCFRSLLLFEKNGQFLINHAFKPMINSYLKEFTAERSKTIITDSVYGFLNQVVDVYNHNIQPLLNLGPGGVKIFQQLIRAILENGFPNTDITKRVKDLKIITQPPPSK